MNCDEKRQREYSPIWKGKHGMMKIGHILFFLLFIGITSLHAITITVTGGFTDLVIDASALKEPDVPGSDLKTTQRSANNAFIVEIGGITDAVSWRVDVKKSDISWFTSVDITLEVRRKSDGSGTGTISGGDIWQLVTDTDQQLFTGTGNRTNIKVQVRIRGLKAERVNIDTYTADLDFTVTQL